MFIDINPENRKEIPRFDTFNLRDENPVSRRIKTRKISNPNPSMREIHGRIIKEVDGIDDSRFWNSFDSPYQNASRHVNNRYFYQTDLKNAFGSVSLEKLANILVSLEPKWELDEVREILARYCFEESGMGLIVGAPASPILFRIYVWQTLDIPLSRFWPYMGDRVRIFKKQYSRYTDDLTFSSPEPITDGVRRMIRRIIEQAGFQVNHRKSTVLDLRKGPVVITGVGLEYRHGKSARLFLPRHYLKRAKGLLHLALKGDPRVSYSQIEGLMGVFHGVNGRKYKHAKGIIEFNATELKFLKMYGIFKDRIIGSRRPVKRRRLR